MKSRSRKKGSEKSENYLLMFFSFTEINIFLISSWSEVQSCVASFNLFLSHKKWSLVIVLSTNPFYEFQHKIYPILVKEIKQINVNTHFVSTNFLHLVNKQGLRAGKLNLPRNMLKELMGKLLILKLRSENFFSSISFIL